MKNYFWFFLMIVFQIPSAFAQSENLEQCLYSSGNEMPFYICEMLRKHRAETAEKERQYRLTVEKRNNAIAEQRRKKSEEDKSQYDYVGALKNEANLMQQAKQDALAAEQNRAAEVRRHEEKEKNDKERDLRLKEDAEQERLENAAIKKQAIKMAEQKAICGEDWRNLRIGMTLSRANQCVSRFHMKAQINRADGVVTTYTAGRTYIHVINGTIVSWGK